MSSEIYSENKKAYYDYNILDRFEAGIALLGTEVKSIRAGHMGLKGSYVVLNKDGQASLIGANISPYQPKNAPENYRADRSRKLLLKKKEIDYLIGKSHQKGLTFIPLRVYNKSGRIKLEFGIGKGKREFDKRETIKERDTKREIERSLKEN